MNHHITGATGFVGSGLVLELLLKTDHNIVGITRPHQDKTATQRLHDTLIPLVKAYEFPDEMIEAVEQRVTGIPGDLEIANCGVDVTTQNKTEVEFWHCAASLQYQNRHQKTIDRTNIGGTTNALELARLLNANRFNMISTAYVAGSRRGRMEPIPGDVATINNLYERSKILAEQKVREQKIPYRIMRPSIVIGHSVTQNTISDDGMYGFLRSLRKFRSMLDHTQPGLADRLEMKMVAELDAMLDLVPVDLVASDAVALSLADAPVGHYHLTNPLSPTMQESFEVLFNAAGLLNPRSVESADSFGALDLKLHQRLEFYKSYLVNGKIFDRSSVTKILGDQAHKGCFLGNNVLALYTDRYIEQSSRSRPTAKVEQ